MSESDDELVEPRLVMILITTLGVGLGEWVAAAVDHQTYKDLHSLVSIYCYNDMIILRR